MNQSLPIVRALAPKLSAASHISALPVVMLLALPIYSYALPSDANQPIKLRLPIVPRIGEYWRNELFRNSGYYPRHAQINSGEYYGQSLRAAQHPISCGNRSTGDDAASGDRRKRLSKRPR